MNRIKVFKAFDTQRRHARRRGKEFLFTFDQWVTWWEKNLGPDWFSLRGRGKGKYVMARKGDKGPYKKGNVTCTLFEENLKQQGENGKRVGNPTKGANCYQTKLTERKVKRIHAALGTQKEIAERFGVSRACVCDIKLERSWKHLWK